MQRDDNGRFLAAPGLSLLERNGAVVDVLWPEFHHVPTTRSGREQKLDGDARRCPEPVPSRVLLDVALRPSSVAGALDPLPCDAERRIARHTAFRHSPPKQCPQRIEKIALPERRAMLLVDHALHMLAVQQHGAATVGLCAINALVAVRFAEIFEDVSPRALRLCCERLEW
jgi:hypothetical protein